MKIHEHWCLFAFQNFKNMCWCSLYTCPCTVQIVKGSKRNRTPRIYIVHRKPHATVKMTERPKNACFAHWVTVTEKTLR